MTTSSDATGMFDFFAANKKRLLSVIHRGYDICKQAGFGTRQQSLAESYHSLNNDSFKILVLGAFKRGKSTFINSLLGEEVLPNFATPCTAVINEVKYGDEKSVLVHFKNPLPDQVPDELSPEAKAHIAKYAAASEVPPIAIPVNELERYVVIPDPAKDQAESIYESPFSHAEIRWPLALCKNGVEIIDSPGLDEHESRTRVTQNYLTKVDAILFVMSCSALAGGTEMDFIQNNLKANGFEEIVFVCNRFDEIRERERERVIKYAEDKLCGLTRLGNNGGLFFVSAMDALDGRLNNDSSMLAQSGIPQLEKSLFQFLAEAKGKIKLARPARQVTTILENVKRDLQGKRQILHQNFEEIARRAEAATVQANDARANVSRLIAKMNNDWTRIAQFAENGFEKQLRLVADHLPGAMTKFEPKESISMLGVGIAGLRGKQEDKLKPLVNEVTEEVSRLVGKYMTDWQQDTFKPWLESQLAAQMKDSEGEMSRVLDSIESMRNAVIAGGIAGKEDALAQNRVGRAESILAGVGGWFLTGPAGAMMGTAFGAKEMLKNFLPSLAILVGTIAVGIVNPFAVFGLLMAGGTIQGFLKANAIKTKIRDTIVEKTVARIKDSANETAKELSGKIKSHMQGIGNTIEAGMLREIQGILDVATSARDSFQKGEQEKQQLDAAYTQLENNVAALEGELKELLFELING